MTLVIDGDTLVQGPYNDFVLFGANREVADMISDNCFYRLIEKNKQIASLTEEKDMIAGWRAALIHDNAVLESDLAGKNMAILNCREEAAANKAWARVGRIGVVTVCVGAAVVGTVAILNSVK